MWKHLAPTVLPTRGCELGKRDNPVSLAGERIDQPVTRWIRFYRIIFYGRLRGNGRLGPVTIPKQRCVDTEGDHVPPINLDVPGLDESQLAIDQRLDKCATEIRPTIIHSFCQELNKDRRDRRPVGREPMCMELIVCNRD